MIEIRVISRSKKKLMDIAVTLIENRLALDLNLHQSLERLKFSSGKLQASKYFMLTGKTKALLFPKIDLTLKKIYKGNLPELYSVPIVHMDWDQAKTLTEGVQSV